MAKAADNKQENEVINGEYTTRMYFPNPFAFANAPFPEQPPPHNPLLPPEQPFPSGRESAASVPPPPLSPVPPSPSAYIPPSPPPLPPVSTGIVTNEDYQYLPLNRAIIRGDLRAVKAFLEERPDATTARFQDNKTTPLHLACHGGQVEIVKELLSRMSPEQLIVRRPKRHTPLTAAAINGNMEIALALVEKNPMLLEIPGHNGDLPVVIAVSANHKILARYLYFNTPLRVLLDNNGYHGTLLLSSAIFFKMLDIALHLSEACPRLIVTKNHSKAVAPVCVLASRPNLFPSGSKLGFYKRFIYSCLDVKLPASGFESFDKTRGLLGSLLQHFSKYFGIHQIYELKMTHMQAQKLLPWICEESSMMGYKEKNTNGVVEAMCLAVKYGTVEFIVEMIRSDPNFLRVKDPKTGKRLFHMAVECKQEKIFSLFYGLNDNKARLVARTDGWDNGILHHAGFLAPPSRLDDIPGPALQLQRELQWFKEIESIVPDVDMEKRNKQSMTPREVFTASHAELKIEAEKWMKNIAKSCSLVAALIVTVTFAAAFTVPGGTDQKYGFPLRVDSERFVFFVVSDIISFFSSCTSVLIFLGILTARYSENDFLLSLPSKMIAGLSIMFVSIAAMVFAFSAALFTVLYKTTWITIPVTLLAVFPVVLFGLLQYPLLATMVVSTFGGGIFNRNMKPWV